MDAIQEAGLERKRKEAEQNLNIKMSEAQIEAAKKQAYADSVVKIMNSITPELTAALESKANADVFKGIANGIAPYAMANNESAADFVNTLLRGTTLEGIVDRITKKDTTNE